MAHRAEQWKVEKIGVIGPGIVGMPMAAMLAAAGIRTGRDEAARVVVIQRDSANSGWKVRAINSGRSVIGGIEPGLNDLVESAVRSGTLSASHDFSDIADADLILVAVQTDKKGYGPDYGPMMGALDSLCKALLNRPAGKRPVVVFESTLAPTSMTTVIREKFAAYGLREGTDLFLGNSPNRVMPGRLVERIRTSDKLVAGLHPETPGKIRAVYSHMVTGGMLLETNALTAEIVKTLENAYRDVRIAFTTEIARYCDLHDIDFYRVRERVNGMLSQTDAASHGARVVPSGGILIPTLGVGGHCLPKDGILLWWRGIERGLDAADSLILTSRIINDDSPAQVIGQAERSFGLLDHRAVTLLGIAYRFDSEDTRNSPSLVAAGLLQEKGCRVVLHDPYVREGDQNLVGSGLTGIFTNDLEAALSEAEIAILGTAHKVYLDGLKEILQYGGRLKGVFDACNIYREEAFGGDAPDYAGIGRGHVAPSAEFIQFVCDSFRLTERGVANELERLIGFLNEEFVSEPFNRVEFKEVQRLAGTCSTGCRIADPGEAGAPPSFDGFTTRLAASAYRASRKSGSQPPGTRF